MLTKMSMAPLTGPSADIPVGSNLGMVGSFWKCAELLLPRTAMSALRLQDPGGACFRGVVSLVTLALLVSACHKEPTTNTAAAGLEKAFQTKAPEPTPSAAPNSSATPAPQGDEIKAAVSRAVTAMRTNAYEEAFVTLHAIQAAPTLTLDQYSAIEQARIALDHELANKAIAGDAAARKALDLINKRGH